MFIGLFPYKLDAQSIEKTDFKDKLVFNISSSLSYATISGDFPPTQKGIFRSDEVQIEPVVKPFNIGVGLAYYIEDNLHLQFDLIFTNKGASIFKTTLLYNEIGKVKLRESNTYNLAYISLPFTSKFIIKNRFYLDFGGYTSILLAAHIYNSWYDSDKLIAEEIRRFDYGLIIGTGVSFHSLHIGFQYSHGFFNILNHQTWTMHNVSYQIILRANIWPLKTNKSAL